MNAEDTLELALLLVVCTLCYGATFRPQAFTYIGVSSINGSDSNAGCPSDCERLGANNENYCDCSSLSETSGVIIDGMIPTINANERGTWASQLYTSNAAATSYAVGFQFNSPIMLREVQLYLFFCPAWSAPTRSDLTINIHRTNLFPGFAAPTLVGTTTLTQINSNCESLIRVSITTITPARAIYFIEFVSTTSLGEVYIGEVIFTDEIEIVTSTSSQSTTSLHTSTEPMSIASSTTTEVSSQEESLSTTSSNNITTPTISSTRKQTSNSFTDESTTVAYFEVNDTTPISTNNLYNDIITVSPSSSNILIPIVAALVGVIFCMATIIIVGGTVCVIVVLRRKRSEVHTDNLQQEKNVDDGYDYINDLNVTVRHGVNNTGASQPVTIDGIVLVKNKAYDTVKNVKVITDGDHLY